MKLTNPRRWETMVIRLTAICLLATLIDAAGIPIRATSSNSTTTCFGDLGCFSKVPPFCDPVYRPQCAAPQELIDTKFLLFKNSNHSDFTLLDSTLESLRKSTFRASLETKILIPGFATTDEALRGLIGVADTIMNYGNYNLILVNWTQSDGELDLQTYPQAVANARVVGAQTAKLLYFLHKQTGMRLETVHIICGSLGTHLAGWAGERLTNLGRISGLDPAGPYFHHAPDIARLDLSDALFVDVIHTNGGTDDTNGFGTTQPLGHIDFYPNGGSMQPGCSQNNGSLSTDLRFDGCSHTMSVYFYMESLNQKSCSFRGLACDSWEDYKAGKCNKKYRMYRDRLSIVMGFHATKHENITKSRKFYLVTNGTYPYCIPN